MSRLSRVLFCLLLLGTAIGLRYPGLDKLIWNLDEGSTFTMAEIVRHGGVIYKAAADNRNPLVPYAKAAILTVVGDWNIRGAHVVMAGLAGLTAILLWQIGRRGQDEKTGLAAALYFTAVSFVMLGADDAMAAHTGWFVIFFSALGMWLFLAAMERGARVLAATAGTAFALSFLSKQPGLLDFGVCLVVCILTGFFSPARRSVALRVAGWATAGFVWPLVAAAIYLAANHALADAIFYAWTYNTQFYVAEIPRLERLMAVQEPFRLACLHTPAVLILGVAGAVALLWHVFSRLRRATAEVPPLPWLILGWTAAGLVSTMLSGRNFAHYSIQVMPGLCLACGWVTARLLEKSAHWLAAGHRVRTWITRGLLAACGLSLAGTCLYRAATFDTSDGYAEEVGRFVKQNTAPEDRIFVWGYVPEIHVFAQRLPSTRFVYTVFLNGLIPWTNLAPEKNTDYAIVPGSWAKFWRDFQAHPPAMIIDTRAQRGYLKYPLAKQEKLWAIVEHEFAEIGRDHFESRGFALYRRLSTVTPAPLPDGLEISQRVKLTGPAVGLERRTRLQVNAPKGTTTLELYHEGKLHRRIAVPAAAESQVDFFISAADLTLGVHRFQAVARGSGRPLASSVHLLKIQSETEERDAGGPPIRFAGRDVKAIESADASGAPISHGHGQDLWDAHPPSRMVYRRLPDMYSFTFSYGIMPGAYAGSMAQKTDGFEVQVNFAGDDGRVTTLYRKLLDPVGNENDTLLQTETIQLPPAEQSGRIVMLMNPGPRNDPSYDWTFWKSLSAERTPLRLSFRGQPVFPSTVKAPFGLTEMDVGSRRVVMIHLPSEADFALQPGMSELAGEFGLLDQTWSGEKKTTGAIFEILQIKPDGQTSPLFTRTLEPAANRDDRGPQSFRLKLPGPAEGELRFVTRPLHPPDTAFGYTYWHQLVASEFVATLRFDGQAISSVASEAPNGFSTQTEAGQPVLMAHEPSRLVFPLPREARLLTGSIGLMQGAYTGDGKSDGATFIIEAVDQAGHLTELSRRFLNPRELAADRGAIPFSVALPAGAEGRLILRTDSAPSGSIAFGWSFWQDLALHRSDSAPGSRSP